MLATAALSFAVASASQAQLPDSSQIGPANSVPGGQINKTLQESVGTGHGDEVTVTEFLTEPLWGVGDDGALRSRRPQHQPRGGDPAPPR